MARGLSAARPGRLGADKARARRGTAAPPSDTSIYFAVAGGSDGSPSDGLRDPARNRDNLNRDNSRSSRRRAYQHSSSQLEAGARGHARSRGEGRGRPGCAVHAASRACRLPRWVRGRRSGSLPRSSALPWRLVAHGLRKRCLTDLANSGKTVHRIMAVSGHLTMSEVERYTRMHDRALNAREAMHGRT